MNINEKVKDLCSDISNILIYHYKGNGTEFAEAKAVEDAKELISTIKQEIIDNACEWLNSYGDISDYSSVEEFVETFRKAMEK